MTFGLTPLGFNAMRLADIKQFLENAFIAEFGEINIDPQSVFGQEIGVLSKSFADIWENLEEVYFSQYPNSASGVSLDNVVQLNGITRLPAAQTRVVATLSGSEGTLIPAGAIALIPASQQNFINETTGVITSQNADEIIVQVAAVAAQVYTIVLSNQSFSYSLPIITFTNIGPIFVAGNSIVVTLNGVSLAAVPYNVISSDATLADVAAAIQAFDAGLTCTAVATNPDIISITPLLGKNVVINSIVITGGATQATFAVTYDTPVNQNAITANLTAAINDGSPPWAAVDGLDGTITIIANSADAPFSSLVGSNLLIVYRSSPFIFLSENFGPIPAPANSLTQIVSPIAGWDTINNSIAGVLGRFIETDAELRIRRANSIKLAGNATVEAIRAHLLQLVPGVTSAVVFENSSAFETDIVVVFPLAFTAGDTVTVTYDTLFSFVVPFNTNQVTTMADIVTAFEALLPVSNAVFGGAGNQTVTVSFNAFTVLEVNSAIVTGVAQSATISGGRPPKSFEAVIEGGSDADIAQEIWISKPAGIETFGNTNFTITDSMGNPQVIYFSRPTPIYIWVTAILSLYAPEDFPVNGILLVAQAINNYGNNLGVGVDVLFQRVQAQVFVVPGIASVNMQIAATAQPGNSPSYGTADITVAEGQIAIFDLTRINVTVI